MDMNTDKDASHLDLTLGRQFDVRWAERAMGSQKRMEWQEGRRQQKQ